jgi:type IV pilus assembly protein PilM
MQIVLGAEKKSEEEIPEDQPIKNIIDQLILQIQKVFQFNASRTNGNPIEKGFIYGGSSNIKGIEEYLSRYLGIEIVKIDEISSVKNKLQLNQGIGTFLNAAGALIRL